MFVFDSTEAEPSIISFLLLSQPSILSSASAFSSTATESRSGGALRQAQTPKRSQAESGRWSHRAGRASHATFHDPSPLLSHRSIDFLLSLRLPSPPPPPLRRLDRVDDGVIACHIDAAPPPTNGPCRRHAVEWWRRRLNDTPPLLKRLGFWWWWAAEPWKNEW